MGQKIRPDSYRLGIIKPWKSIWFFKGHFGKHLEEDEAIRNIIYKKISQGGIADITIERTQGECRVNIKAARPGLIIGRGGEGVNKLKAEIEKTVKNLNKNSKEKHNINLNIEELKRTNVSANYVAQQIAWDLEKRMKFRRTIKHHLDNILQIRGVKGAKIRVSGRLDGAEIARAEWVAKGTMPLQTLRADIDYGTATAFTIFGTIGIKVWVNMGEVFDSSNVSNK
ncbi:MAG: 30S ribosomal protein S3 [Candidatus Liptonbacteria bacterium CG11_big_fil_rev_8_21_14_0_20_35_14]|uniref:Small ribosomal subunit protein uS3 n=1 Tax=Candidatus Liptonbacteria bacterium CG11_big_fil_rev_8_21_14_0_20_35_14 TaxID=1974634 RepID=A0A2H0N858_9BACT|nr:MAG: 30S ribosomal protein S3 [Candidatus Liptonbacteria bacterium CG11_big_fil_rev_8_21_14_0_20_35_14]